MTVPYDFRNPDIDKLDLATKANLLDEWSRALRYSGYGMSKRIPWDDCTTNAFTDIGNGLVLRIDLPNFGGEAAALAAYGNVGVRVYCFYPRFSGYCLFGTPLWIGRVDLRAATPGYNYTGGNVQLRTTINMTAFASQYLANEFNPAIVEFAFGCTGFTNNANTARGLWGRIKLGLDYSGRLYVMSSGAPAGAQNFPGIMFGAVREKLGNGSDYPFAIPSGVVGSGTEFGGLGVFAYTAPSLTLIPQKLKLIYPDSWCA